MGLSKFVRYSSFFLFTSLFTGIVGSKLVAQEQNMLEVIETVVDFYTKDRLPGVLVVILERRDDGTWEEYARITTDKKANVTSQMYLQKEYMVVFSKKGYIKKKILIDTRMDGVDEDFYEHDNTLFLTNRIVTDQDSAALLDRPVVRVYFDKNRKGFVFDSLYKAQIQNEFKALPPDLTDVLIKRIEQNAQSQETDPIKIADEQRKYDSLLTTVDQKKKQYEDSLLAVRNKAIQDSLNAIARAKFLADSIRMADSLMAIASTKTVTPVVDPYKPIKPVRPDSAIAARPIITKTITPPNLTIEQIIDEPLVTKEIVLNLKMQDEIFVEKGSTSVETNKIRAVKLAAAKEQMDNMHIKYQTGSPFISLLDEIDMFEKGQKNKANKP